MKNLTRKVGPAEAADLSVGFTLLFLLGGLGWLFIALVTAFAMEASRGGADFGAKKIRI